MDKDQYQEPEVAYEADEGITAIASAVGVSAHAVSFDPHSLHLQNDLWLSASHDSQVRSYLHGKPDLHGLILKAAGISIRALAVDPLGKRVAVASECVS